MEIVQLRELNAYQPKVGTPFKLVINDSKSNLLIHPYYYEDEIGFLPNMIGGFDVYDEDGNYIDDCKTKTEILNCI